MALTQWMSLLDPQYTYRIITENEADAFRDSVEKMGTCRSSKNYVFDGIKDVEVYGCEEYNFNQLTLVFEKK